MSIIILGMDKRIEKNYLLINYDFNSLPRVIDYFEFKEIITQTLESTFPINSLPSHSPIMKITNHNNTSKAMPIDGSDLCVGQLGESMTECIIILAPREPSVGH